MTRLPTLYGLLLSLLVLINCKDDEKPLGLPTASIILENEASGVKVLDTLSYSLETTYPKGLGEVRSDLWVDGQLVREVFSLISDSVGTARTEQVRFVVEPEYAGKSIMLTLFVSDRFLGQATDTLVFSVQESAIEIFENRTIGAFSNGVYGSFYDAQTDTLFFGNNIQSNATLKMSVDLVVYFSETAGRGLAAPAHDGVEDFWKAGTSDFWPLFGVENETSLYNMGSTDFDVITTAEQLDQLVPDPPAGEGNISGLIQGQVIGFQTASNRGSKKGMLLIREIEGATSDFELIVDVKIQK